MSIRKFKFPLLISLANGNKELIQNLKFIKYILLEWHFKFLVIAGVWTIAYLSVEEDILEHDLNEGLHLSLMKNKCQC